MTIMHRPILTSSYAAADSDLWIIGMMDLRVEICGGDRNPSVTLFKLSN